MKVIDIINNSSKPFASLEIVPPLNGITKDQLIETIKPLIEFDPKYMNVTCHRDEVEFVRKADGSYARHTVRNRVSAVAVCAAIMAKYDLEMVPHIICGGASMDDIQGELHELSFMGIQNVLALRGDSLAGEKRFTPSPDGYTHADELVAGIRQFEKTNGSEFCIGVGAYPEKHFEAPNIETDIANLKKKVDAGADYIITQMFFDNQVFYDFEKKCREAGIMVPVIPGIKPISTARQIGLLPESFSLDIPVELTGAVRDAGDDKEAVYRIGTEWSIAQCKDLIAHGVPAIHLYTMGKTRNIVEILKECF